MKFIGLACASLLLAGCGSIPIQLQPSAENIKIVDYLKPNLRSTLVEIDQVKCKLGENARTRETNIEACYNDFRNKASSMNGDLVLVTSDDIKSYDMSSDRAFIAGTSACGNCVQMRGIVFKKK